MNYFSSFKIRRKIPSIYTYWKDKKMVITRQQDGYGEGHPRSDTYKKHNLCKYTEFCYNDVECEIYVFDKLELHARSFLGFNCAMVNRMNFGTSIYYYGAVFSYALIK